MLIVSSSPLSFFARFNAFGILSCGGFPWGVEENKLAGTLAGGSPFLQVVTRDNRNHVTPYVPPRPLSAPFRPKFSVFILIAFVLLSGVSTLLRRRQSSRRSGNRFVVSFCFISGGGVCIMLTESSIASCTSFVLLHVSSARVSLKIWNLQQLEIPLPCLHVTNASAYTT